MEIKDNDWLQIFEDTKRENSGYAPTELNGEMFYKGDTVPLSTLLKGKTIELENALQRANVENDDIREVIEQALIPGLKDELTTSDKKAHICSAIAEAYYALSNVEKISKRTAGEYAGEALYWKAMAAGLDPRNADRKSDLEGIKRAVTKQTLLNENADGEYTAGIITGLKIDESITYSGISMSMAHKAALQFGESYRTELESSQQGQEPRDKHNGLDHRDVHGKDRKPETPELERQTSPQEDERRRKIEELRRKMEMGDQLRRGHSL